MSQPDVTYAYDNLSRLTGASQTGNALTFTWDALGRNLTQVGPLGTVVSEYDLAGRRTKLTYPGTGLHVSYDYLVTGEMTKVRENGATSGVGVLATYAYDDLGRRTSLTRGNGAVTSYTFDAASRLDTLVQNLNGTANDLTLGFDHNPAGQIVGNTRSNDIYAWTGHGSGTTAYAANGLNQLTSVGGTAVTHDSKGNMTSDGLGRTFTYSSENLMRTASGGVTLAYDPMLRLYQLAGVLGATRFAYDGLDLIAEYNGSNVLQRRYVHGPGMDEPLVQYEGTGTTDRRFLHADERGSIIAMTDNAGALIGINAYDEFGVPGPGNAGRFQYTGQAWLEELGLHYYKARMYHPRLGRFMQTDPIGYEAGMNLYAYVKNDPVNFVDPLGLEDCVLVYVGTRVSQGPDGEVVVIGVRQRYCKRNRFNLVEAVRTFFRGGRNPRQPRQPRREDQDYCSTAGWKIADMAESIGEATQIGGYAIAAMASAEQYKPMQVAGIAAGLAVAGFGGTVTTIGSVGKFAAGDKSAAPSAAVGMIPLGAFIPKSLRNDVADAIFGDIVDLTVEKASPAGRCNK